jgi:ribosomal protein L37AE/L43A
LRVSEPKKSKIFLGEKMRKVKKCPQCGSTNIKWVMPQMWSLWECYDCGYQGALVIEEEEEESKDE